MLLPACACHCLSLWLLQFNLLTSAVDETVLLGLLNVKCGVESNLYRTMLEMLKRVKCYFFPIL